MSLPIHIKERNKCNDWLTLDMWEVEDTRAVVVVPMFGPDHLSGIDCWCYPCLEGGVIVHNVAH